MKIPRQQHPKLPLSIYFLSSSVNFPQSLNPLSSLFTFPSPLRSLPETSHPAMSLECHSFQAWESLKHLCHGILHMKNVILWKPSEKPALFCLTAQGWVSTEKYSCPSALHQLVRVNYCSLASWSLTLKIWIYFIFMQIKLMSLQVKGFMWHAF